MSTATITLEEYAAYITSTVAFMEMWKSCYLALLSNPKFAEHSIEELHDLSWKHAKELKRATRQYLEQQHGDISVDPSRKQINGN